MKDFVRAKRNNRERSHTGVGPSLSKQALTLHQLKAVMRGIYRLSGRRERSVIHFSSHSRSLGNSSLFLGAFEKGLAWTHIGTPVKLDPFSETNYTLRFLRRGGGQLKGSIPMPKQWEIYLLWEMSISFQHVCEYCHYPHRFDLSAQCPICRYHNYRGHSSGMPEMSQSPIHPCTIIGLFFFVRQCIPCVLT